MMSEPYSETDGLPPKPIGPHPRDPHVWRPDEATIGWVMSNIDEAAVGRAVIEQLKSPDLMPELEGVDPELLGGTAVEGVLFTALNMVRDAQKAPPGTPV